MNKSIIQQALSDGTLSPSEALALHKTDYPDIESWKEYKEAAEGVADLAQKAPSTTSEGIPTELTQEASPQAPKIPPEGTDIGVAEETAPQAPQEATTPAAEPTAPSALTQWKPEAIEAINEELSTIEGFTSLISEAEALGIKGAALQDWRAGYKGLDVGMPDLLIQARKFALARMYKRAGRIQDAKNIAGNYYDNWTKGIKAPPKLLTDAEKTKLRENIQEDIRKKVAAEFPAPKPPTGLTKTQEKQVAKELKVGVTDVLRRMGRNPDGSIKAKEVKLNDGRDADGNLLVQTVESHKNFVTMFLLIAIGMLILAIPPVWPYGYYTLLRLVVSGVAVYAAYVGYNLDLRTIPVILGLIALLFNPVIPIHLTKEIWTVINIIVAIVFLIIMFILRKKF